MPQFSGFFTAEEDGNGGYDRVYTAEQFAYYFSKFIGNGVYMVPSTQLQVSQSPTPNMSVNVAVGDAYINGYFYKNTTVANLSIEIASGPLNRIDMIVLRWDNLTRSIELKVLKGKEASQATPPTLTRNADVYELCLAKVSVSGATSQITNSSITDTRGDNNLCGFVHGVVSQVDTTTLWQQYATKFEELYQSYNKSLGDKLTQYGNSYQSFVTEYSGKFNKWFNDLVANWTDSDYAQMLETIKSNYVSKKGDTMTGNLIVNSGTVNGNGIDHDFIGEMKSGEVRAGDKAWIDTSNEGGELTLVSPSGYGYQFDVHDGNLRIVLSDPNKINGTPGSGNAGVCFLIIDGKPTFLFKERVIASSNVTVQPSLFVSDTTYPGYIFKANITVTGCTTNHVPIVTLSPEDAISGNFAPVATSGTNVVTIYAKQKPTANITIQSIVLIQSGL